MPPPGLCFIASYWHASRQTGSLQALHMITTKFPPDPPAVGGGVDFIRRAAWPRSTCPVLRLQANTQEKHEIQRSTFTGLTMYNILSLF